MEKILVIDDEVGVVEVISEVLIHEGYEVKTTTDGFEAMELIEKETFDLVITDLKMPDYDGIEITHAVKKRSKETDVVVITGYASLESAVGALKIDVYDYILKPFNISEILSTASRIFEKQHLKKRNEELSLEVENAFQNITTIYEIGSIINSLDDLDQILAFTSATIAESVGIDVYSILLKTSWDGELEIKNAVGLSDKTIKNVSDELVNGEIIKKLNSIQSLEVDDFQKDETFCQLFSEGDRKKIDRFVCVPLKTIDDPFGYLIINKFKDDGVKEEEKIKLIEIVATQIAPKIKVTLLKNEIESYKTNRLYFLRSELKDAFYRTSHYDETLIIMLYKFYVKRLSDVDIDINLFNEKIYEIIKSRISKIDYSYKFGLDAFITVLQGKNMFDAESLGKSIKEEVEKDMGLQDGVILYLDYGYSLFPSDSTHLDELISKAQNKLWKMVKK